MASADSAGPEGNLCHVSSGSTFGITWSDEPASERFATGLPIRIRSADGKAEIVNAGNPPPFLVREAQVVNTNVESAL